MNDDDILRETRLSLSEIKDTKKETFLVLSHTGVVIVVSISPNRLIRLGSREDRSTRVVVVPASLIGGWCDGS